MSLTHVFVLYYRIIFTSDKDIANARAGVEVRNVFKGGYTIFFVLASKIEDKPVLMC